MSTDNTSVACPQCGAMGIAGKFCQFCGTKIPMPAVKAISNGANDPIQWPTVCPFGYVPDRKSIVGNADEIPYMVVKKVESRQFVETVMVNDKRYHSYTDEIEAIIRGEEIKQHPEIRTRYEEDTTYAVIDRNGDFVVGPNSEEIQLFADNLDCLFDDHLFNYNFPSL